MHRAHFYQFLRLYKQTNLIAVQYCQLQSEFHISSKSFQVYDTAQISLHMQQHLLHDAMPTFKEDSII